MPTILIAILGFIIVTVTILDIMYTVLAPNGSGIITGKVSHHIWRTALKITNSDGESKLLSNIGLFLLLFIVQFWVALVWIGNALILYSDPEALYNTTINSYVSDFSSQLYFSGYVLSAMGNGDYTPASEWWKFYTSFISFTGVIFISLSISYLIPVIQAVTNKRSLSLRLNTIGGSPEDMILSHWKDDDFKFLIDELYELEPLIFQLSQQHMAYPVIHYFHSTKRFESTSICLAMLDETLSIIQSVRNRGLEDETSTKINSLRKAITYFLSTLRNSYINPGDDEPLVPDLDYFNERNIPKAVDDNEIEESFRKQNERRKLLLAYVQSDAWQWKDVVEKNGGIQISN